MSHSFLVISIDFVSNVNYGRFLSDAFSSLHSQARFGNVSMREPTTLFATHPLNIATIYKYGEICYWASHNKRFQQDNSSALLDSYTLYRSIAR